MLSLTAKTKNKPEVVVKKAVEFFGGYGLKVKEQGEDGVSFEGGGGYININASVEGKLTTVDFETREWEEPVREFARTIKA